MVMTEYVLDRSLSRVSLDHDRVLGVDHFVRYLGEERDAGKIMPPARLVSVVTPCYNEEETSSHSTTESRGIRENKRYDYEHIFIDNASTDGTIEQNKWIAGTIRMSD